MFLVRVAVHACTRAITRIVTWRGASVPLASRPLARRSRSPTARCSWPRPSSPCPRTPRRKLRTSSSATPTTPSPSSSTPVARPSLRSTFASRCGLWRRRTLAWASGVGERRVPACCRAWAFRARVCGPGRFALLLASNYLRAHADSRSAAPLTAHSLPAQEEKVLRRALNKRVSTEHPAAIRPITPSSDAAAPAR